MNSVENKFFITINNGQEEVTIERIETDEELQERIKMYKDNNIEVKKVVKEIVKKDYVEINI